MCLRCATVDDARTVAELMAVGSDGIALWLWRRGAKDGEDPLTFGARRAARADTVFSYRNAVLAERAGTVAGMMLGYRLAASSPVGLMDPVGLPPALRPLAELEDRAPGGFQIGILAVYGGHRDSGVGTRLLQAAASRATSLGCTRLSVRVFSQNIAALRLYERNGFRTVDSRPIEPHPSHPCTDRVLLLTRPL